MRLRIAIGALGILLGLFGVFRLLTEVPLSSILTLLIWLVAALILHDGVLSPILAGIGWGMDRALPPRGRRFLAYALIAAGAVTVIALPEIHRENSQPASKAILQQNYALNLAIAFGVIAAVALLAYGLSVVRDRARPRPSVTNERPPLDDQLSSTE